MPNLFKGIIYFKNLLEAPIYPETIDMVIASLSPFYFSFHSPKPTLKKILLPLKAFRHLRTTILISLTFFPPGYTHL